MSNNLQVARHELKYYISRSDYEYVRNALKNLMQRDLHQKKERGYFIRSLYLDDINDSAVEEKLAGIEKRDKYRLRIYDFKQDWVKLERKKKENNYVIKTTAIITKKETEEIMKGNYNVLLKYKNKAHNSIYYDFKKKYFSPVVIVDYIREAYLLDYNNVRITFDKHLRGSTHDLRLFESNVLTRPLQRSDVIIMEVKFNHFLPPWFKTLFQFDSATVSAISKYCQSRMNTREYYNV